MYEMTRMKIDRVNVCIGARLNVPGIRFVPNFLFGEHNYGPIYTSSSLLAIYLKQSALRLN